MRKILRNIARYNMKTSKVKDINDKILENDDGTMSSYFQKYWRTYIKSNFYLEKGSTKPAILRSTKTIPAERVDVDETPIEA